jgi:multiple sugar transport system ATP-binding protein
MRDGVVEQRGKPLELYDHPANLFVAGFIGSPAMNFIPATLRRRNGACMAEFADGSLIPAPDVAGADGLQVIYGVRPEHLSLGEPGAGLKSEVVVVEPTGADTQVYARFNGIELTTVFRERHDFAPGSTIHLLPDHDRTHLFDAESGQVLTRE